MSSSSSSSSGATTSAPAKDEVSSSVPPPYPTADTVPFPYETPYGVQLDLMDAMLTALRPEPTDGKGRRSGARIVMLESPTGTGKSLSLGCAALAWLRHGEVTNLLPPSSSTSASDAEPGERDGGGGGKDDKGAGSGGGLDWLDDWTGPSSSNSAAKDEERRKKDEEERRLIVSRHRDLLEGELDAVRRRIEGKLRLDGDGENAKGKKKEAAAMRSARGVVAGEAVRLARERFAKQADRRRRGRFHRQPRADDESDEEEDFCLDEYNSDDNGGDCETDSSSSSSSASEKDEEEDGVAKRAKSARSRGAGAKTPISRDATALLDGGALDGSSSSSSSKHDSFQHRRQRHRGGAMNDDRSDEAASTTVGGVSPGSGVRKIIYAARTHSQLSQFVSELRRVPSDRNVRVVALGGRKLLCGNPDVVGPNNKYRSEAVVNERCLDLQRGKKSGGKTKKAKDGTVRRRDRGKHRRGIPSPVSVADAEIGEKRKRPSGGGGGGSGVDDEVVDDEAKKDGNADAGTGCPLLRHREVAVPTLALHALAHPTDVEDLADMGRSSGACAYYAARESLPAAEVVAVPYSTLLSPQARNAVGLSLRNSLVIIDEAHNVPEALRSLSRRQLNLPTVEAASVQLDGYVARYRDRLAGRNLFYLGQLRRCLEGLGGYLRRGAPPVPQQHASSADSTAARSSSAVMMTTNELLFALGLDNVNLFKVDRYLERSRLAQKLLGFANFVNDGEEGDSRKADDDEESGRGFVSKHVSAMSIVQEFLACLNSDENVGKIVAEWPLEEEGGAGSDHQSTKASSSKSSVVRHPTLRYALFNPSSKFGDVVQEAHAVVLAGGTLRPFAHVSSELLGGGGGGGVSAADADGSLLRAAAEADEVVSRGESSQSGDGGRRRSFSYSSPPPSNLSAFSCGHVVHPSHVYLSCISSGPTSTRLDFRHRSRSSDVVCDELGRTLVNLVNVVPKGFIVFLPSYKYEAHLVRRWRKTGVLDRLGRKKAVHREPKNARDVDWALASYSKDAAAAAGGGAILFCVIGGKMSEGINFADDMARCVLVVGLPYPDIGDPELVEKMAALDREVTGEGANRGGSITGRSYYQNLCMRAVNQSVGRAIRHVDDYAAILLADFRYAEDNKIWSGLPRWLRGDAASGAPNRNKATFGSAICGLSRFFRERRAEA